MILVSDKRGSCRNAALCRQTDDRSVSLHVRIRGRVQKEKWMLMNRYQWGDEVVAWN